MNIDSPAISSEALSLLKNYPFPGNVRELERIIEAALTLSSGCEIQPGHLRLTTANDFSKTQLVAPLPGKIGPAEAEQLMLERSRTQDEKQILTYLYQHSSINNRKCRELLSVDKARASYLLKKMCQYGLLGHEGENRWSRYVLKSLRICSE